MSNTEAFPAICDNCCGPNKHIKMIRQANGEECKICTRPFTVFRWNIANTTNHSKKTIICMTCARSKNCCQSCMLDITYMIPLEIRDTALKMAGLNNKVGAQESSKNKEVKAIIADKQDYKFQNQDINNDQAKNILAKLAEKLNSQKETTKKISKNLKNDKVNQEINMKNIDVSKILTKLPFGGLLKIPESDPGATSFFIFGFNEDFPQYLISNYCIQFGKLKNIALVHRAKCGFISFVSRKAAEEFALSISKNGLNENPSKAGLLLLDNKFPLRVAWGKSKSLGSTNEEHRKIGLVVMKVMKQLAENNLHLRDKKIKSKSLKKPTSTSKFITNDKEVHRQSLPPQENKTKYKASMDDVEL